MFSEKYLAGFADADGHFSVRARIGAVPDLTFSISQHACYLEPLIHMQDMFGGVIRETHAGDCRELCMRGGPARKVFERLKKYLVLKRDHAELYLELVAGSSVMRTEADVARVRSRVKEIRKYGATREPNYPSRKWMAGYVDGDGSFVVKVCKRTGNAYPALTILAAGNYHVGITLLHKAFGGRIQAMGENAVWSIPLTDPSKIKEVLGFCAPHLRKKQAQAYFLLGCAQNGNLRDGEAIRSAIKTLNAQQHRLSDSAGVASDILKTVRFDIPPRRLGRPVGVVETRPRRKRQSDTQVNV